jgi:hypothetical protein
MEESFFRLWVVTSSRGQRDQPRHRGRKFRADSRMVWADEPIHLGPVWRALSARDDGSHEFWTDDYLAAFAQAGDFELATLDGGYAKRYPSVRVETLV